MTKEPTIPRTTRAKWRESVRAELLAGGVGIELTPSGMTRVYTQHDFVMTSDLADLSERDIHKLIHRSQ